MKNTDSFSDANFALMRCFFKIFRLASTFFVIAFHQPDFSFWAFLEVLIGLILWHEKSWLLQDCAH